MDRLKNLWPCHFRLTKKHCLDRLPPLQSSHTHDVLQDHWVFFMPIVATNRANNKPEQSRSTSSLPEISSFELDICDGAILEVVVWKVPEPVRPTEHGYKYSAFIAAVAKRIKADFSFLQNHHLVNAAWVNAGSSLSRSILTTLANGVTGSSFFRKKACQSF